MSNSSGYIQSNNVITTNGFNATYIHTPQKESKPMTPIAGAAPVRTLHTRAAQVKGGYVGQVVYGDPERQTSDGTIVWESKPCSNEEFDGKSTALVLAQAALDKAFISLFDNVPVTGPRARRTTKTVSL